MKILILKNKPLEYQAFPLYYEDGVTPLGILVEIDDELMSSGIPLLFNGENVVVDAEAKDCEIVKAQKEEIERQIGEQKQYLRLTDYLLFKVMDGALSAREYDPIKQKRSVARETINLLEEQLNTEG